LIISSANNPVDINVIKKGKFMNKKIVSGFALFLFAAVMMETWFLISELLMQGT